MNSEEYRKVEKEGKEIYKRAKENKLTDMDGMDRWGKGIDHHPKSLELMTFLEQHDLYDCDDYFCWNVGGDGDNGEALMYEMDAYFEQKDIDNGD